MGRSRASDSLSSLLASWRSSGTCGLVIRADQCRPQWASHPSVRDRRGALLGLFQGEGGRAARAQSPQLRPVGSQMANTNLACESESRSVMSDSLRPHGLLQSMEFSRPEYWTGSLSLLQGIFPTQGSNPGLPHCGWILYQLSHKGSPRILEWVAYPFSSRSSQPRNRTRVSYIGGGFFTN